MLGCLIERFVGGSAHQWRGRRLVTRSLVSFHFAGSLRSVRVVALLNNDVGSYKARGLLGVHTDFASFLGFLDLIDELLVVPMACDLDSIGETLLYMLLHFQVILSLVNHLGKQHLAFFLLTQGDLL